MPRLVSPLPNEEVPYEVTFEWTEVEGAVSYELEVENSEKFAHRQDIYPRRFEATSHKVEVHTIGPVWWRVRGLDSQGRGGPWSRARKLVIQAPPLAVSVFGVSVVPASVIGGSEAQGLVRLETFAPAGGATVELTSTDARASVPRQVLIPAGWLEAAFTVTTKPAGAAAVATISAISRGDTRTAKIQIGALRPPARLHSVRVNPAVLVAGAGAQGTVALDGPAPEATTIRLVADDKRVSLPETVTVPAGARAACFPVQTAHDNSPASIVITAASESGTQTTCLNLTGAGSMNALRAPSSTLPPNQAFVSRQTP